MNKFLFSFFLFVVIAVTGFGSGGKGVVYACDTCATMDPLREGYIEGIKFAYEGFKENLTFVGRDDSVGVGEGGSILGSLSLSETEISQNLSHINSLTSAVRDYDKIISQDYGISIIKGDIERTLNTYDGLLDGPIIAINEGLVLMELTPTLQIEKKVDTHAEHKIPPQDVLAMLSDIHHFYKRAMLSVVYGSPSGDTTYGFDILADAAVICAKYRHILADGCEGDKAAYEKMKDAYACSTGPKNECPEIFDVVEDTKDKLGDSMEILDTIEDIYEGFARGERKRLSINTKTDTSYAYESYMSWKKSLTDIRYPGSTFSALTYYDEVDSKTVTYPWSWKMMAKQIDSRLSDTSAWGRLLNFYSFDHLKVMNEPSPNKDKANRNKNMKVKIDGLITDILADEIRYESYNQIYDPRVVTRAIPKLSRTLYLGVEHIGDKSHTDTIVTNLGKACDNQCTNVRPKKCWYE